MLSLNVRIRNRLRLMYVVTDFVTTNLAMFLFNIFRVSLIDKALDVDLAEYYRYPFVLLGQTLFPLMMMGIYWLSGYYNKVDERSRAQEVMSTASSVFFGSLGIFFIAVINDGTWSRTLVLEYLLVVFGILFACVYVGRVIITSVQNREHNTNSAIMLGVDDDAAYLAERVNDSVATNTMRITSFVRLHKEDAVSARCKDFEIIEYGELRSYCQAHAVSRLIVSPKVLANGQELADLIRIAADINGAVFVLPDVNSLALASHRSFDVIGEPLVCVSSPNISESTKNLKRAVDIVGAILALILVSPLMLVLAIGIKRDSKGPVFFTQERLGYGGKPFKIIKLRSMTCEAESDGIPRVTTDSDDRITGFGRFLRKYRLDELPQFWNVLKGEMSLVGPRPERRYFAEQIAAKVSQYPFIYQVRPGITSWGMVRYGYASNVEQMVERLRYDLIYIENISILTDIKILLHTVRTVVSGRGK